MHKHHSVLFISFLSQRFWVGEIYDYKLYFFYKF